MYSSYLKGFLKTCKRIKWVSSVVYSYDYNTDLLRITVSSNQVQVLAWLLRLHLFLLVLSTLQALFLDGVEFTHGIMCVLFITAKVICYYMYSLVFKIEEAKDGICLLNKMLKLERAIIKSDKYSKTFSFVILMI